MAGPKTRILNAARDIFLEGGADSVTMRAVAERVGVTATALYRHFENKEALVRAVMSSGFETFGGYLHRALRGRTPMERLRLSGQAYLDFALEQPELYRTIFMTPWRGVETKMDPQWNATFQFLVDRVRECIAAGELKKGEPADVAVTIWAHVHGLVSLYLVGACNFTEKTFRSAYRQSVDRLFEGLTK